MNGGLPARGTDPIRLPGISAELRLVIDETGLTHIFAESTADVFFGQGFNAARERLWQIDLWRRRGLGQLAAAFGPGFVAQDRATRMLLPYGDTSVEWAACWPGTRQACEHFTAGINAYVDLIGSGRAPMPVEFTQLGIRPDRWDPDDVIRVRSNTIQGNAVSELRRSGLLQDCRRVADTLRCVVSPPAPDRANPVLRDCAQLVTLLDLASAPVVITARRLAATMDEIDDWSDPARFAVPATGTADGSNNWAVGGGRTATSRPLLANDPHRALQTPSLRHAVHLVCPEFSVIGGGEPALPGIAIGHNGMVAYGLTICPADQEDVFCFTAADGSPEAIETSIAVRGHAPLPFTVHRLGASAVLRLDRGGASGVALRTVCLEPGAAPYLGSLALATVAGVCGFRARLDAWLLPAVNYVAADGAGSIGWFVAGAVPVRTAGAAVIPSAAGDPWTGFMQNHDLPTTIDPGDGFVMSANELNVPAGWGDAGMLSREWYEPFRADRIREVLHGWDRASLPDSDRLQGDTVSMAARALQRMLRGCPDRGDGQTRRLLEWDCGMRNETEVVRLYRAWLAGLKAAALPAEDRGQVQVSTEALILAIQALPGPARAELLCGTLAAAVPESRPRRALFRHAIQDDVGPFHHGPVAWDGDDTTVHFGKLAQGSGPGEQFIEFGASFRVLIDVGDWDNSLWQNRPHTDVGGEAGGMRPLLYTPARIAAAAVRQIVLSPQETAA